MSYLVDHTGWAPFSCSAELSECSPEVLSHQKYSHAIIADRIERLEARIDQLEAETAEAYDYLTDEVESIDAAVEAVIESIDEHFDEIDESIDNLAIIALDCCTDEVDSDPSDDNEDECNDCETCSIREKCEDASSFSMEYDEEELLQETPEVDDEENPCIGCTEDCEDAISSEDDELYNMNVLLSRAEIGKLYHLIGITLKNNKDYLNDVDVKALYHRFKAHLDR